MWSRHSGRFEKADVKDNFNLPIEFDFHIFNLLDNITYDVSNLFIQHGEEKGFTFKSCSSNTCVLHNSPTAKCDCFT